MSLSRRARWLAPVLLLLMTLGVDARTRPLQRPHDTPPHDIFSASEPGDVRTTHLWLDLDVDFEAKQLRGTATHTIVNLTGTRRLVLDTRNLVIHDVTIDGEATSWSLGSSSDRGRPLTVDIETGTRTVRVEYETTSTSEGLNWSDPLQTTGGVAPFLFTFGQPDHTREWIPIQDTPGIRMKWGATVRVPAGLLALMSAENPTEASPDGAYHFEMSHPMPPYLIALAVGRLEFRELGPRTGFYAEPEFVDDAAWDLQYVPDMLEAAEELLGTYPFERYDLLLAPPGFQAGGMENPMLNFLNVMGAVSGNREDPPFPTSLVAHELAHSWAGDRTTCATWSDTWLNEGFATYYSSRILEKMVGPELAEIFYHWDRRNVESFIANTLDQKRTILHREFKPGESASNFNTISYNKGSLFLKMLEDRMGREAFDTMILAWLGRHRYDWVDDLAFVKELRLSPAVDEEALRTNEWIYGTGLPDNVTAPVRSALWERVAVQANRYRSGVPARSLDTTG